jgi:hypothetical protein
MLISSSEMDYLRISIYSRILVQIKYKFDNTKREMGGSIGSQPQKSPKSFKQIAFCRVSSADHFGKKKFLISVLESKYETTSN